MSNRNKAFFNPHFKYIIADVYFVSNRNNFGDCFGNGGIIADVYFVSNRNNMSITYILDFIIADVYFVSNRN